MNAVVRWHWWDSMARAMARLVLSCQITAKVPFTQESAMWSPARRLPNSEDECGLHVEGSLGGIDHIEHTKLL